jgi:hypothetical protein
MPDAHAEGLPKRSVGVCDVDTRPAFWVSYRQALCPPELLGRMNASIRFLVFGALPLGGLVGGLAGERLGVHVTLWLCGIGLTLTPVPLLASPLRRPASEVGPGQRQ